MSTCNLIGPQLARLRREAGYSQQKLAERLQLIGWDVSRDIIARIEQRIRRVTDFEVELLARGLGANCASLLENSVLTADLLEIERRMRSTRGRRV